MDEAARHAELGLPVPKRVRFRLVKRLVARASWLFLHHQVAFNKAVMASQAELIAEVHAQLTAVRERIELETQSRRAELDLLHKQAFARHHAAVSELRTELSRIAIDLAGAHRGSVEQSDRLAEIERTVAKVAEGLRDVQARQERELVETRTANAQVNMFLATVRKSFPETPSRAALEGLPTAVEALYPALQDAFRGSEATIRDRVSVYLPDVAHASKDAPVLDLGCGRGEWLEVLRTAGLDAYGIELHEHFAKVCLGKGLDVRNEDALDHLRALRPDSLSAITAFHLVEHIPVEDLVLTLDLARNALRPGGVLILETPNPDNVTTGASNFYLDPTHQRPIPAALLLFLVVARGYVDADVRYLHAPPPINERADSVTGGNADVLGWLNDRLNGPQDYAVVAYKPE